MVSKKAIVNKLKEIPDPELGISIVDLGLIYNVEVDKKGVVTVTMTLTTIGCPLFDVMAEPIKEKIKSIDGVNDVFIELTFDPPWNVDRMSEEARIQLGFA